MTPIEYQELAARTMNFELNTDERLSMLSMGLSGEAGEVTDYLKKVVYHGHQYSGETLCKELGDVMWYLSNLAYINGIDLETVMEENIKKLKERYPDGFSVEDSVERRDVVDVDCRATFYDSRYSNRKELRKQEFLVDRSRSADLIDRLVKAEPDGFYITRKPSFEVNSAAPFTQRLYWFVTNPLRYLIWGNVKW